jgi:opacity protein-like surface antigen
MPTPSLYLGAGAGWYHVTLDVEDDANPLPNDNETFQEFGVHVGGGLRIPMGGVALDLNGRYVLMQDQESELIPDEFDPDFWSLSAGLGFRF